MLTCCAFSAITPGQGASEWLAGLPEAKDYVQKRASSYDRSGGNADYRRIAPGEMLVLMDEHGRGEITHFWTTMWAEGPALKALVLRMYWDEETTPSVESPLGDFFGLGLGDYVVYESAPLAVAPNRALNSFFPCRFKSTRASRRPTKARTKCQTFISTLTMARMRGRCQPTCSISTRNIAKRRQTMGGPISGSPTVTRSWKTRRM